MANPPITTNNKSRKPIVYVGARFGKLTVTARDPETSDKWLCKCDCGGISSVWRVCLSRGDTKSCGCMKTKYPIAMSRTATYASWKAMRGRCNNKSSDAYKNYGGRGIEVCARWNDFLAFREDMGERPSPKHTIDRIDNDGDYEPSNCRWATRQEQNENRRPTYTICVYDKTYTMAECAGALGLKVARIYQLRRKGLLQARMERDLRV